jgi:hypothetical protein
MWDRYGFDKKRFGAHYAGRVFLHPVGYVGNVMHSGVSEAQNNHTLFFMLRWEWYGFHKNHAGTYYAKHVFFHLVGYAGHVVHSSAYGSRNVDALFFMLGRDRYESHKSTLEHTTPTMCFPSCGICGSHSAFRCIRGAKHQHTIFHARVGPIRIRQKVLHDMLCRTCVSASDGIYGSHSAF